MARDVMAPNDLGAPALLGASVRSAHFELTRISIYGNYPPETVRGWVGSAPVLALGDRGYSLHQSPRAPRKVSWVPQASLSSGFTTAKQIGVCRDLTDRGQAAPPGLPGAASASTAREAGGLRRPLGLLGRLHCGGAKG